jgi:phosphatidylserine decarboxylase
MSDPPPFPIPPTVSDWIKEHFFYGVFNGDITDLNTAMATAVQSGVPQFSDWGILDSDGFQRFMSGFLTWVPTETTNGKLIYNTQCLLYFVFDQAPLNAPPYQYPIAPSSINEPLLKLSQFIVDFANEVGSWMDTTTSLTKDSIATFQASPLYNYAEADPPPGGYTTFNELFSRHLKQGMRPISGTTNGAKDPNYNRLVTYPADSTFDGAWSIDDKDYVDIKGIEWNIEDLLQKSTPDYAPYFSGGIWMHAFLNTFDYHRQHAPIAGKVVEANVIQAMAYLQVTADPVTHQLRPHRSYINPDKKNRDPKRGLVGTLDAPDDAGYQWLQTRGCVIIENELLGYVAVLPIGMCQVSSVKLAVSKDDTVTKGQEISHFEFGGSDIVLVFQQSADIQILGAQGTDAQQNPTSMQKYLVGMPLGYSTKGMTPQPGAGNGQPAATG